MRTVIVSQGDTSGGAARAAYRLHCSLRSAGADSSMIVSSKGTSDFTVQGPASRVEKAYSWIAPRIERAIARSQRSANPILHSANVLPSPLARHLRGAPPGTVANVHWVNDGGLSVEQIGALTQPVVMTLHDAWAFSGSEHHFGGPDDQRYRQGYSRANRPRGDKGFDLDAWTWRRKRARWTIPRHVVCPSRWLADAARASALMQGWPVSVIPNPVPTDVYKPLDKAWCRDALGLPAESTIVLFGAIGGGREPWKGFDLLVQALSAFAAGRLASRAVGVVVGQSEPRRPPAVGIPLRYMGFLHDDWSMALLYGAADVTVVPSRVENLPQMATEAQACGCPVVAFRLGGLPDIVAHLESGYLAAPLDPRDLARGIEWVTSDVARWRSLSAHARERALASWSPPIVAGQYLATFASAAEEHDARLRDHGEVTRG